MPSFCDVAVIQSVPLDMVFTYRVPDGMSPVVGGRVLVPFRNARVTGLVTALHDTQPSVTAKDVYSVLDAASVLSPDLLKLGEWIAQYYLAPIGDVYRAMLPLQAEVKRAFEYTITDAGLTHLQAGADQGSSRRSKLDIEAQMSEYAVLDYLAQVETALEPTIRSATGANREMLQAMARKKWITREDVTDVRDARRTIDIAVLVPEGDRTQKLNANQQTILTAIENAGGRLAVSDIRALDIPATTLKTLVNRGLVRIEKEKAAFHLTSMKANPTTPPEERLNDVQRTALEKVDAAAKEQRFSVTLLHGVTGSGKTAVYLAAMKRALARGQGAIMLVPEIGLTPAAAANLHAIFGEQVAILHSALTNDERAEQWHRIRRGEAQIVVGTRSAVFAPAQNLALIIVDEEHDNSYKQEETPRYNGRDVAVMRGKIENAAVILGSATPSLESYRNATQRRYELVEMRERVADRPLPEVTIVDMRLEFQLTGKEQLFSQKLIEDATERLDRNEQIMILLNRRGYSSVVLCRACGQSIECANCAIAMTYHRALAGAQSGAAASPRLECHYCGYRERVPTVCPKCGSEHIYFLGHGSEKIEEMLHGIFPKARIGRMDRDTVRGRDDFERVLNQLHAGEIDLLVGTQMIAKGHDIPNVTLVGVVGADFALGMPDFRAAERTFQLLTQVAGRAGRGSTPGEVILQTYHPEHYAIQYAAAHDYRSFADKELRYRTWMHYPPFGALANLLVRSDKQQQAMNWTGIIARWFEQLTHEGIRILGPSPAPISRLKRDYRYHFVLKSPSREKLNALLRAMLRHAQEHKIPRTNVIVDVDPQSLM
ncbi:MAG TPA: primosomal protein N' [Terriglobales bacterium]